MHKLQSTLIGFISDIFYLFLLFFFQKHIPGIFNVVDFKNRFDDLQ